MNYKLDPSGDIPDCVVYLVVDLAAFWLAWPYIKDPLDSVLWAFFGR